MSNVPPVPAALRGAVDLSSLVSRANSPAQAPGAGSAPGDAHAPGAPEAGAAVGVPALAFASSDSAFGQVLELSKQVPVVIALWSERSPASTDLVGLLEKVVTEQAGRLLLAVVETETNPQLAQAFQAQAVPTVAALVAGQPVQLFQGTVAEDHVRDVLAQVITLAQQNGVTGVARVEDAPEPGEEPAEEPAEEPLSPAHQTAYEAIENHDYPAAIAAYRTAIAQDPRDDVAVAGLAQVELLDRLQGRTAEEIRRAAGDDLDGVDAQLAVADLDLSGGHIQDAFDRILELFPRLDADDKTFVRKRIVDLFTVVGAEDARVVDARRRLANLLY